jgi:DNA-binding GntR family transcriptional regulator
VYAVLKERILSQEIELGARLRDEELASQLEVSRTPVREALMRLHREGLVDVVPRSGTMVRMFTESDVEQIYDIRCALESLAVRRAAKALKPEQIRQLQHLHVAAEAAFRRKNFEPVLDFDRHMHRVILEACGNRKLQELMATINDFVALFRNLGARLPAHRGFNYRHREIVQALVRRDPDAAARSLAEHIEGAKEQLLRDLQERQILQALGPASRARGSRTSDRKATQTVNRQHSAARRAAHASRRTRGGGSAR